MFWWGHKNVVQKNLVKIYYYYLYYIVYNFIDFFLILNYYKILDSFYYYTVFGIASVLMIIYNILVSINIERDYEKK